MKVKSWKWTWTWAWTSTTKNVSFVKCSNSLECPETFQVMWTWSCCLWRSCFNIPNCLQLCFLVHFDEKTKQEQEQNKQIQNKQKANKTKQNKNKNKTNKKKKRKHTIITIITIYSITEKWSNQSSPLVKY